MSTLQRGNLAPMLGLRLHGPSPVGEGDELAGTWEQRGRWARCAIDGGQRQERNAFPGREIVSEKGGWGS